MKSVLNIIFAICVSLFFAGQANAQIIVAKKPLKPKILVVKTSNPGPGHKWIEGYWKVKNNKYTWKKGYWAKAKRHHIWLEGHWKKVAKGWKWIPGHWKKLQRR